MFNPETDRSEDVSHSIAQEILRRIDLKATKCRRSWKTSSIATSVRIVS